MLPSRAAARVSVAASRFRRAMMYSALLPFLLTTFVEFTLSTLFLALFSIGQIVPLFSLPFARSSVGVRRINTGAKIRHRALASLLWRDPRPWVHPGKGKVRGQGAGGHHGAPRGLPWGL